MRLTCVVNSVALNEINVKGKATAIAKVVLVMNFRGSSMNCSDI